MVKMETANNNMSIDLQGDVLTDIRNKKRQTRIQIAQSAEKIKSSYQQIVSPPQKATTKMEAFMNAFDQGVVIYDGVMMGLRIVRTLRGLFGRKRR